MKAMVFAAGLGTRLRPLTDSRPKALIEVAGIPALQRVLERIRMAGIRDVVVNVHHFPEMIIDFLRSHDDFGLNISISDERERLLDTGGGLLSALPLLGDEEPVLLHNADIVTDFSINEMIEEYDRLSADALLLVSDRPSSRRLLFDSDGRMVGWKNMSTGQVRPVAIEPVNTKDPILSLAFGGVHIVSPSVFPYLQRYGRQTGDMFSITPFYIDNCTELNFRAFQPKSHYRWHDIGSIEKLACAEASMSR